jgi:DNA-binding NarL/FixJ family response regulator
LLRNFYQIIQVSNFAQILTGQVANFNRDCVGGGLNMSGVCPTVIVSSSAILRKQLSVVLCPPAFRVVTFKRSISEISLEDIPRSDAYLLLIECIERSQTVIAELASIKRWNTLARVALLGSHYQPNEIAKAFQAGANAYFAEATISKDVLAAIRLITSMQSSTVRGPRLWATVAQTMNK